MNENNDILASKFYEELAKAIYGSLQKTSDMR
jgi:hypothetical protein